MWTQFNYANYRQDTAKLNISDINDNGHPSRHNREQLLEVTADTCKWNHSPKGNLTLKPKQQTDDPRLPPTQKQKQTHLQQHPKH